MLRVLLVAAAVSAAWCFPLAGAIAPELPHPEFLLIGAGLALCGLARRRALRGGAR